jgi:hypothetical protein
LFLCTNGRWKMIIIQIYRALIGPVWLKRSVLI